MYSVFAMQTRYLALGSRNKDVPGLLSYLPNLQSRVSSIGAQGQNVVSMTLGLTQAQQDNTAKDKRTVLNTCAVGMTSFSLQEDSIQPVNKTRCTTAIARQKGGA
jgi:hypothetical protein